METKICTSIEQSEKLVKLGLDKTTADMHYFSDGYNPTRLDIGYDKDNAKFYRGTKNKYIPAWSLNALLELMPQIDDFGYKLKRTANHYYVISYFNLKEYVEYSPIDSCYKMVVWLIENGYIKTK